jgi:hypothetical protein
MLGRPMRLRSLMERPTCRTAITLKTGFGWFKLPIACLIAILAWQVSRGADKPAPDPGTEWHLSITMLNAHSGDGFMEEEDYGSNEPPESYDGPLDWRQDAIQMLPPPRLDHTKLLVNCRILPPSGELKPALLRRRRT